MVEDSKKPTIGWCFIAVCMLVFVLCLAASAVSTSSVSISHPTNTTYFRSYLDLNYSLSGDEIFENYTCRDFTGFDEYDSLLLYLKLDEMNGSYIKDHASANNGNFLNDVLNNGTAFGHVQNNGTITGAAWNQSGKYGYALSFDGIDDYVSIPSKTYDLSGQTFSFWAKRDVMGANHIIIGNSGVSTYRRVMFTNTNKFYLETNTDNNGCLSDNAVITDTDWHHYAVSVDNYICTMYMDSAVVSSTGALVSNVTLDRIGSGSSFRFNGIIDSVRIFNRALTQEEIQAEMNSYAPVKRPVLDLEFSEGSGTLAQDTNFWLKGLDDGGFAMGFDGIDDYVDTSHDFATGETAMTITAWALSQPMPNDGGSTNRVLATHGGGVQGGLWFREDTNWMYCGFRNSTNVESYTYVSFDDVTVNTWQHWTCTIDINSDGKAKLYHNGSLVATSGTAITDVLSGATFNIGGDGANRHWNGTIDSVRIWNRALTQEEIQAEMNSPFPVKRPVAAWEFGNGSGVAAYDRHIWVNGSFGSGLGFDGIDDYARLNGNVYNDSDTMTWNAWIYLYSQPNYWTVLGNWINDGFFSKEDYWYVTSNGYVDGELSGASGYCNLPNGDGTQLSPGQWYMLTLVYNGTHTYKYLDGLADGTAQSCDMGNVINNGDVLVGATRKYSVGYEIEYFFNGTIDEVMIWDRALTGGEIGRFYNATVNRYIVENNTQYSRNVNLTSLLDGSFKTGVECRGQHVPMYSAYSSVNYTIDDYEETIYYGSPVYETTMQNYSSVIQYNPDLISDITSILYYNGTSKGECDQSMNSTHINNTLEMEAEIVQSNNTDVPFYFQHNVTYHSGTSILANSSTNTQATIFAYWLETAYTTVTKFLEGEIATITAKVLSIYGTASLMVDFMLGTGAGRSADSVYNETVWNYTDYASDGDMDTYSASGTNTEHNLTFNYTAPEADVIRMTTRIKREFWTVDLSIYVHNYSSSSWTPIYTDTQGNMTMPPEIYTNYFSKSAFGISEGDVIRTLVRFYDTLAHGPNYVYEQFILADESYDPYQAAGYNHTIGSAKYYNTSGMILGYASNDTEYDIRAYNATLNVTRNGSTRLMTSNDNYVSVYRIILAECNATYNTKTLGLSVKDEVTRSPVNGSVDALFSARSYYYDDLYRNTSFGFRDDDNYSICLHPEWAKLKTNAMMQYWNESVRSYYLTNATLTNTTQSIDLYVVEGGTTFTIYVKDSYDNPVEGIDVNIRRYYLDQDSYVSVDIVRTDYDGKAVTSLVENTVYYSFLLQRNGSTLREYPPTIVSCTETPCTITLYVEEEEGMQLWDYFGKISYSCAVNRTSNVTRCTVNDPTGLMIGSRLLVEKQQQIGWNITCDTHSNSSSATLICNLGAGVTGLYKYTLTADVYNITYTLEIAYVEFGKIDMWGEVGLLLTFIIIGTLGLMAVWHPGVSLVLSLTGLLASQALGLINVSLGSIIGIAIAVGIIIYKMKT